jgi:hypothetical protein
MPGPEPSTPGETTVFPMTVPMCSTEARQDVASAGPGRAIMETVEFVKVKVLDASSTGLLCRIKERDVLIPPALVGPGSRIRSAGDRGTLVIPRWLAIGLGLVSPFSPPTAPRHDPAAARRRRSRNAA